METNLNRPMARGPRRVAIALLVLAFSAVLPAARPLAPAHGAHAFPAFLPNGGQASSEIRFERRLRDGLAQFTTTGVRIGLDRVEPGQPAWLEVQYVGARRVEPEGIDMQPGTLHVHLGPDPSHWQVDLPTFGGIRYPGLYPGIDLVWDGSGPLKGNFVVQPGADPSLIRWRYQGAAAVDVDGTKGDLVLELPGGASIRELSPVAWRLRDGRPAIVDARYVIHPDQSVLHRCRRSTRR